MEESHHLSNRFVIKRHLVVATAGHIDHGKTSLVRALTGMETDRLVEERRRGITIELGFAFLGDSITIIDVPGHERFVKTMVAGVSAVDLALLVIAADDGFMPQTREHLAVLHLLRVPHLMIALTKIDGQDIDWLDLIEEEIRADVPTDYLETLKIFRCDSLSGEGIPELKAELLNFADSRPLRETSEIFRLPVDRAFSMKGYGAVVTGTIIGGSVKTGDKLQALTKGSEVRVRGLQCHGQTRQEMAAGERAAINVIGSDADVITRGDCLCQPNFYRTTDVIDVEFTTLPEAPLLKNRDRVRLHLGTNEILGRLVLMGSDVVEPGGQGFAQFLAEKPLLATRGDRFVFRRYSPLQTWGGGAVLDPLPQRKRRSRPASRESFQMLAHPETEHGLLEKVSIEGALGFGFADARTFTNLPDSKLRILVSVLEESGDLLMIGSGDKRRLFNRDVTAFVETAVIDIVSHYHQKRPEYLGIPRASLMTELASSYPAELIEIALNNLLADSLAAEQGIFRLKRHAVKLDDETEEQIRVIASYLLKAGLTPPDSAGLSKELNISEVDLNRYLQILNQQRKIVRLSDGTPWSTAAVQSAWDQIKPELKEDQGKPASELRELIGCPRRVAIKLLEYFDHRGLLDRREDLRYPGRNFDEKI
ncbi:selenocysteine-specific translation elongation factor [bacterium]|nr:selenocysteine-specific translation elongation factor [bacterium]